ncbi:TPA: hypothetical protein ENG04_12100 [Candidatus Poribacteria bacterium]|nr:hypothetical protein [Candidatus Poribacteria bacterium]HEX30811.1 hypothetical protein [Candidatus Poribacteria bacterium]
MVRKSGEKEEDELTFEELNRLIDRLPDGYSDDEAVTAPEEKAEDDRGRDGSIGADETTDERTRVEGSGGEVERLIQQIRYEQLARLLPRFLELQQEYHDLNKMRDYLYSSPLELPGVREEIEAFQKRETEICKEEGEIMVELAELFPEAVVYKPYEGPDSPGYFSIDYRKLRELVGGRLPVEPYFRP